jgi:hypothetical protein
MVQRVGGAYAGVPADHHRLIRAGLAAHGREEIVIPGDELFAGSASQRGLRGRGGRDEGGRYCRMRDRPGEGAGRRQQPCRLTAEPPQRELQNPRARVVKPLQVVNSKDHRPQLRQVAENRKESDSDRSLPGRAAHRIRQQQRDLQRPPLRRRQPGKRPVKDPVQQIAEGRERPGQAWAAWTGLGSWRDVQPSRACEGWACWAGVTDLWDGILGWP